MQNDIGSTLKKVRKSKGLTQQQLAEKSNLSRTYLSDVENNRYNPSITFVKSVSEGLGDGDENSAKEIYTTLMNALGYVEEQTPIEKAVSEYINLTGFISSIVNSYKSSQLQINSLKEFLENAKTDDDIKELTKLIALHEHRIKDDDDILPKAFHRIDELELLVKDGMQYQKNKVNEHAEFKLAFYQYNIEKLQSVKQEIKDIEDGKEKGDLNKLKEYEQRLTDRIAKYNGTYTKKETETRSVSTPAYMLNLSYTLDSGNNIDLFFDEGMPITDDDKKKLTAEDKQNIASFIKHIVMKDR